MGENVIDQRERVCSEEWQMKEMHQGQYTTSCDSKQDKKDIHPLQTLIFDGLLPFTERTEALEACYTFSELL